jgi:hypothetical protein
MNVRIATCSTAILLALAAPAYAEVVTLRYQGTLNSNIDWPVGVVMTGFVTYDTEAAPTFIHPTFHNYPIISHTANLDGVAFDGIFLTPQTRLQVANDHPSGGMFMDQFTVFSETDGIFEVTQTDGTRESRQVTGIGFSLLQQGASPPPALDSLDPPSTDEDLAGFPISRTVRPITWIRPTPSARFLGS